MNLTKERGLIDCSCKSVSTVILITLTAGDVRAHSIELSVDSSLAEYLLALVCSDNEVDQRCLRNLPALQSQIKHHSNFSPQRDFDAFMTGLDAVARCETTDEDPFRFAPVVERKKEFEQAVAFFKEHSAELTLAASTAQTGRKMGTERVQFLRRSWHALFKCMIQKEQFGGRSSSVGRATHS